MNLDPATLRTTRSEWKLHGKRTGDPHLYVICFAPEDLREAADDAPLGDPERCFAARGLIWAQSAEKAVTAGRGAKTYESTPIGAPRIVRNVTVHLLPDEL